MALHIEMLQDRFSFTSDEVVQVEESYATPLGQSVSLCIPPTKTLDLLHLLKSEGFTLTQNQERTLDLVWKGDGLSIEHQMQQVLILMSGQSVDLSWALIRCFEESFSVVSDDEADIQALYQDCEGGCLRSAEVGKSKCGSFARHAGFRGASFSGSSICHSFEVLWHASGLAVYVDTTIVAELQPGQETLIPWPMNRQAVQA